MNINKTKITIVGGGSTWTPGILKALTRYKESISKRTSTIRYKC